MELTQAQYDALPTRHVNKKTHLPYEVARHCLQTMAPHVKSAAKYRKWIKETKSYFMPVHPERVYPGFDWAEFLGKRQLNVVEKTARDRSRVYRPLWDAVRWAQRYCRANGITLARQWVEHYDTATDIPADIPKYPKNTYAKDWPGFAVWSGKTPGAVQEAAIKVEPILALLHPVKTPQNVVQLVTFADGIGQLREIWSKQSDFDRIIGCWKLEREKIGQVEALLRRHGTDQGGQFTIPNLHQLTWELNDFLDMVRWR